MALSLSSAFLLEKGQGYTVDFLSFPLSHVCVLTKELVSQRARHGSVWGLFKSIHFSETDEAEESGE